MIMNNTSACFCCLQELQRWCGLCEAFTNSRRRSWFVREV